MATPYHHLRALMVRRDFLEERLAVDGWDKWKQFELAALSWALGQLEPQHQTDFDEASRSAGDVMQRRAESRAARGL
jgi:hypothetical protein